MEKLDSHLREGFPKLHSEDVELLAQHMTLRIIPQYQTLYRKGDGSDAFCVILSGRIALVDEDARPLFTLTAGNLLGEQEFFRGEPHTLTSRAESETSCMEISAESFAALLRENPEVGMRIADRPVAQLGVYVEEKLAQSATLKDAPADALKDMASLFRAQVLLPGERLYSQGDAAQGLFLSDRGRLMRMHGADVPAGEIPSGSLLGVDQLYTDQSYDHSVVAEERALCWALSRGDFQRLNNAHPILARALARIVDSNLPPLQPANPQIVEMLSQAPALDTLGQPVWEGMAARSQAREVQEGVTVYRMGEPGDAFFLVMSGEIELTTATAAGVSQELRRVTRGGLFGLESLLRRAPHAQQAAATRDTSLRVFARDELLKLGEVQASVLEWLDSEFAEDTAPGPPPAPAADLGDMSMFGVFRGLSGPDLARFLPEFEVATFYPQESIYESGTVLDRMYLLQKGTVMLTETDRAQPRYMQPGVVLNLATLMAQTRCPVTATASTDVRLITLPFSTVMRLASDIPTFFSNLWRMANAEEAESGETAAPAAVVPARADAMAEAPLPEPYTDPAPVNEGQAYPYAVPADAPPPQFADEPRVDFDPYAEDVASAEVRESRSLTAGGILRGVVLAALVIWLLAAIFLLSETPPQWVSDLLS